MLREEQREYLVELAREQKSSMSEIIRKLIDEKRRINLSNRLRAAAQSLAEDYQTNDELTSFTALDGEDFA